MEVLARSKMVSVTEYGAVGDGVQDSHDAFQQALDSPYPVVTVPCGAYRIHGTLQVPSGKTLRAHSAARIVFGDGCGKDVNSYMLTNYPNVKNIVIEGGIWNGNASANSRSASPSVGQYHGVAIGFSDVTGLILRNMTIQDSEAFHIRLNYVEDFLVEKIVFEDQIIRHTQDGIHIAGGCKNGVVRHIRAVGASAPNDDMIALVSDVGGADSPFGDLSGERPGDIKNIHIYDVQADHAFSILRILSTRYAVENITMCHVRGGCYYLAVQLQMNPFVRNNPAYDATPYYGSGNIRRIRLSDWKVYRSLRYMGRPEDYVPSNHEALIDIEQGLTDFEISDFIRDTERDAFLEAPTLKLGNRSVNLVMYDVYEDDLPCRIHAKTSTSDELRLCGNIKYFYMNPVSCEHESEKHRAKDR